MDKKILIAVTGASGSVYAERLVEVLLEKVERIYLVFTDVGKKVTCHELETNREGFSLRRFLSGEGTDKEKEIIRKFNNDDLFSPVASGSSAPTHMVIVPCSMGTLGRISNGVSSNLIERAADVVLKESDELIVVPRETPFSTIHLENLLKLSRMGVKVIPAMPAFYNKPKTIDDMVNFVVARILKSLKIEDPLLQKWNSKMI